MALKEFLVVLLLTAVACFAAPRCPAEKDFPACICLKTENGVDNMRCLGKLRGKSIEEFRVKPQENHFDPKTKIDLTFSNVDKESRLPSNIFEGLHIKSIHFDRCKVSKWADYEGEPAFVGLEDTLEKLVFTDSIKKVKKVNVWDYENEKAVMSLGQLRKLHEVTFALNSMFNFGNDWFGNFDDSLKVLQLNTCELYFIGDKAFAALVNLKQIWIVRNEVSELTRSMFSNPAEHLEEMYLWRNKLKTLPDDMFTNMPSLTLVDLSYNPIYRLPENVWRPVWSRLEHLGFKDNKLYCDEDIEWMFKVRHPKRLIATCEEPDEMKGVDLFPLIKEKQSK